MSAEYKGGEVIGLEINLNREDRTINVSDRKQKNFVTWIKDPDDYKRWLKVVYQVLSVD